MTRNLEWYRDLTSAFLQDDLTPAIRESRGRELGDAAIDLVRGLQIAGAVLPGLTHAAMRGDETMKRVMRERQTFSQLRTLTDLTGLDGRGVTDTFTTGLSAGIPLISSYARQWTESAGHSPIVPGIVDGPADGVVDPDDFSDAGTDTWQVDDVGAGLNWHYSVMVADVTRQLFDFATPAGERLLDQILFDVADRGAEKYIGAALVAAAGTIPTAEGTDLGAAIDTAESLASAGLNAPADLLIVNPADWPHTRRAVASAWQLGPAPTPILSIGVDPGTLLVTGREAFNLFKLDHTIDSVTRAKNFTYTVGVARPFYLAVKNHAGIQTVSLEA